MRSSDWSSDVCSSDLSLSSRRSWVLSFASERGQFRAPQACAAGPRKVSEAGKFLLGWTGRMGSGEADSLATAEDLLLRVARQDRAAYRALYDAASAKLFGVALRICRERSLAAEAFQEAFVGIWRQIGRAQV